MRRLLLSVAGLTLLATAPAVAVASTPNVTARAEQKAADNAPKAKAKSTDRATDKAEAEPKADPIAEPPGEDGGVDADAGNAPLDPAENFSREAEFGDAGADNMQPPIAPVAASGISSPTPLWAAAAIIVLLMLVAGMLWWSLQCKVARIEALEKKIGALDKLVRQLDQPGIAPEPFPLAGITPQPTARIGGYEAGWDAQQPERAPPPPKEPKPAVTAFDTAAAPSARAVESSVSLAPLQEDLARLITNPAMRTADYDDLLRRYGEARGYAVQADDGAGRLTSNDGDASRWLTALALNGSDVVALLPSARFIRDFVLFKERLEVGSDVKALFDLEADGSAQLRIERLAHGRAGADGTVHSVQRGRLAGFVR